MVKLKTPPKKGAGGLDNVTSTLERALFSSKEKQAFLEDLSTLIDDGVPANKAVEVMAKLTSGATKRLVDAILSKIAQGKPIADGMIGWMPDAIVELIRAGEQGGTLAQNMRAAGESLGRKNDTLSSLSSSLTYPLVVLVCGLGVLVYLNNSIFPQFASIKPVSQWPDQGRQLIAIATFVQDWWWGVLLVIIGFSIALNKTLHNYVGKGRESLDRIPLISIYREVTAARFMETLGLLVSNGVVFKQALQILQGQADPYLGWHLMMMERRLGRGRSNIAEVLDTNLVSDADILRLKAIADAKGFDHALIRLGRQAADRGVETLRKLGRIGGGLLLALGAGLAGYMVTGIYTVGSSLS